MTRTRRNCGRRQVDRRARVCQHERTTPGNEYFSDGISEELPNLLAKIPELRVISRSSAFSFKGRNLEIPEIARRLNVGHILEGSVRKAGNQVRITAQLIDARSDSHLMVGDLRPDARRHLCDPGRNRNSGGRGAESRAARRATQSLPRPTPRRMRCTCRLSSSAARSRPTASSRQSPCISQALAIDPSYAPSWDGLAASYLVETNNGLRPAEEGYRPRPRSGRKGSFNRPRLRPGPRKPRLAGVVVRQRPCGAPPSTASAPSRSTRPISASSAPPLRCSTTSAASKNPSLSGNTSRRRDPVASNAHTLLGHSYLYAGRWEEAAASYRTALRLSPSDIGNHHNLGLALLFNGEPQAALEAFEQEEDDEWRVKGQALALHALGRQDEYRARLAELIEGWGAEWPSEVAHVYAFAEQCRRGLRLVGQGHRPERGRIDRTVPAAVFYLCPHRSTLARIPGARRQFPGAARCRRVRGRAAQVIECG